MRQPCRANKDLLVGFMGLFREVRIFMCRGNDFFRRERNGNRIKCYICQ